MLLRRISTLAMSIAAAMLLAAGGCTHKEPEPAERPVTSAPTSPTPSPATELSPAPTDALPADSSLSIKRGIVTAAGDHAMFRACDDKTDLWLVDEADGTLTQLLTEGDDSTFYVEAYGERGPVPDSIPAARGQAGAFVLEQLLYAGAAGQGRGCEQPAPDYIVSARGNEPFWSIKVTDTNMVWKQADAPQESTFDEMQSEDAEGSVSYRASTRGSAPDKPRTLELVIDALSCRDSLSGEYFAFSARATLDGRDFKGCGRVGKQDAR